MSDQVTDKRRRRETRKSRARSPNEPGAIHQPTPNPQDETQAESAAPRNDIGGSWFVRTVNGGFLGRGTTDKIRRQLDCLDALEPGAMLDFAVHPATDQINLAEEQANITSLASAVGHLSLDGKNMDMDMDMEVVSPMPSTREATTAAEAPATPERRVTAADEHEESDSYSDFAFVPKLAKKRGVGRWARPVPVNHTERCKQRAKTREAQKLARAQRALHWSRRAHGSAE
jgi:hypothetical protein